MGAVLAAAGVGCATAPERGALGGAPVHSAEALRADLAIARAALEEGDPGVYRFAGRAAVDLTFERAAARIPGPLTSLEFYRLLGPAVAAIRNGHTQLSLDATTGDLLAQVPRLPSVVRLLSGRLRVLRDFSGGATFATGWPPSSAPGPGLSRAADPWGPALSRGSGRRRRGSRRPASAAPRGCSPRGRNRAARSMRCGRPCCATGR